MRTRRRPQIVALAYDKRGRLLSVGKNSYTRTHPVQAKYARMAGKPAAIFLHAEIAALLRARTEVVYKLVIKRFDSKVNPVLAAPCPICQLAIRDWGVKIVEHT